jgi:transcriptional regulator with XRE-family HTH domain
MAQHLDGDTLGQRIRSRRRSLFITQDALAKAVDVSQSAVGQWERDETIPALRHRAALAGALATFPHVLFDDVEAVAS